MKQMNVLKIKLKKFKSLANYLRIAIEIESISEAAVSFLL